MPGDNIDIAIDRDGDGRIDEWATKHLTVGAVGYTPEEVRKLRRPAAQPARVVEMGTGHYRVTYKLDSPGQYEMAVLVSKRPIAHSPFIVDVGDHLDHFDPHEPVPL